MFTRASWRVLALALALAGFLAAAPARAASPHGLQPGWCIDDSGNILITDAVADRMAQSGAGWVRLNFRLGPYPSDTSEFYSKYDTIVNRLRSRGLQIVGLMSNESWRGSQSDWCANSWERTGGDGYNTYIDQFGYAFARMASRWQGKIKYWEVWNEPNCWNDNPSPGVFTGGTFIYPSNFAAMLTHCHSQVRYYNNIDVRVISGGLFGHDIGGFGTGPAGADYLNDTYNVGINYTGKFAWAKNTYGTYPLDAVGQHIYINQGGSVSTTWFGTYLDYVRNVVTNWEGSGSPKKTWLTEFGWQTNWVSESTQSSNLNASYNVFKGKSYAAGALWFQMDDNPPGDMWYGLFRSDLTKKPSWTRFNTQNTYQGRLSNGTTNSAILNKFNNSGGLAANGSPYDNGGTAWAHWWDYGYVQDFDGGSVGRCAIFDTGYRVQSGFWTTYLQGNNHNILRFPTSDEFASGSGTRQNFQGGYMTWDPTNGVRVFAT
jgi:hypothetical protein